EKPCFSRVRCGPLFRSRCSAKRVYEKGLAPDNPAVFGVWANLVAIEHNFQYRTFTRRGALDVPAGGFGGSMLPVRPWVIGATIIAFGFATQIAFIVWVKSIAGRVEM